MSSLQCPARIFLARHGEAAYETDLVTDDGGALTHEGRTQARALAERLSGAGIRSVWTSPLSRAVQTAELAAGHLGVELVVVRNGLREYGVGSLAGTDGDEGASIGPVFRAWAEGDDDATIDGGEAVAATVARVHAVLREIADTHRGEGVLVISHGGAILASVPELVGAPRLSSYDVTLPGCGFVELEADDEGWRVVAWDASHTLG
jgi:probable phosphoglycerate mutase